MKFDIRAAVVGTGYMGKRHIEILKDQVKSLVICSTDEATCREIAEAEGLAYYTDYEEMFQKEELDCVHICVPTFLHYPVAMSAFAHGISVLCEKPFSVSREEAERMVAAAEEKNLLLMVGHVIRFNSMYEYLRICIKDGRFGNLLSLNLYRHHPKPTWSVANWLADAKLSGGVIKDLHIHDTDILVRLLGVPKGVRTWGNTCSCTTVYGYEREITVTASASWRNGANIVNENGFDAVFERAVVRMEHGKLRVHTEEEVLEDPQKEEPLGEAFSSLVGLENEILYFCRCYELGLAPEVCLPEEVLKTMLVNEMEAVSLEQGKEVEVLPGREPKDVCSLYFFSSQK